MSFLGEGSAVKDRKADKYDDFPHVLLVLNGISLLKIVEFY
jgi:hypothetical protein